MSHNPNLQPVCCNFPYYGDSLVSPNEMTAVFSGSSLKNGFVHMLPNPRGINYTYLHTRDYRRGNNYLHNHSFFFTQKTTTQPSSGKRKKKLKKLSFLVSTPLIAITIKNIVPYSIIPSLHLHLKKEETTKK